mgnify:CR=1 FL=1
MNFTKSLMILLVVLTTSTAMAQKENAKKIGIKLISIPMLPWIVKNDSSVARIKEIAKTVKGKYYTIREVFQFPHGIGVTLEEIANPLTARYQGKLLEPNFDIERFRELEDLPDIAELLEEVLSDELVNK